MSRLALNKATLGRERRGLDTYRRYLPSLDLKRRQLIAERAAARARLEALAGERERLVRSVGEAVPMLAETGLDLDGLVRVRAVRLGQENVVGTPVPVVESVDVERRPYGLLARPHWVDRVADLLEEALRLEIEIGVARERLAWLETAVRKVTQRVNLFEKVLIPRTQANLRRIRIHLGDHERAGVVTAKLAKRRQAMAQ